MRLDTLNNSEDKLITFLSSLRDYTDRSQSKSEIKISEIRSKVDLLLCKLIEDLREEREKVNRHLDKVEAYCSKLETNLVAYKASLEREAKAENKKLKERITELEKFIDSLEFLEGDEHELKEDSDHYYRARALAIFDKILYMISKWSNTQENSIDFEAVSRAILIPSVYLKIAKFDERYLLKDIPDIKEVVIEGRKYISELREDYSVSLDSKSIWDESTLFIKMWWIDYALPKILNFSDPSWDTDPIMDWESYKRWDVDEKTQAKMYPPVYDTMYSQGSYENLTKSLTPLSLELENPEYKF